MRLLDGEDWQTYTRDFEHSAFRMEVHGVYTMPGEADDFRQFLAGEPMPEGFNADWHDRIRANIAAGKTITRGISSSGLFLATSTPARTTGSST